ncbi:MAG TPA: CRISPR-associated protein Cas4 [Ktedonobacteraceae bacterium]|jgi:CRISPR-associated exonuclease Cas4|nr:CRISPR-associated protein Cas4 [Ktedonobacteraceae bacterium]
MSGWNKTSRPLPESIPISFLNALEYCPRRFYYEFVQGDMLVNAFVLEGSYVHRHVDQPGHQASQEGAISIRRLYLASETLHLSGFADIVEEEEGRLIPIEYKHGKEGKWLNDHIQLCAQALCLEERQPERAPIPYGFIFYFGSRKRIQVPFTPALREKTRAAIELALHTAILDAPPPPLDGKAAVRCRDCSLRPLCLPDEVKLLLSQQERREGGHATHA